MKKTLLFATTLCASGFLTDVSAQELIRTSVPKEAYAQSKNFELVNQQRVKEAYRNLKEVYAMDFSGAQTKSVLPGIGQEAFKMVSKAGYVDYSNQKAIGDLLSLRPEALTVNIPFEGEILVLDLVEASLFGDAFTVQSNDPSKVQDIKLGVYYQGTIRGTNSLVGMSFFEKEYTLLISRDTDHDRTIESGFVQTAENTSGTHIIYSDDDLKVNISHSCQAEELEQYQQAVEQLSLQSVPLDQEKATFKCVTYFWETAYNLYTSKGSTQAVTNYMTSVFNNFQLMNNNE